MPTILLALDSNIFLLLFTFRQKLRGLLNGPYRVKLSLPSTINETAMIWGTLLRALMLPVSLHGCSVAFSIQRARPPSVPRPHPLPK